ncbi:glycosyltransferase family 2 protein [Baaleninema simplex]|uniref:glycosyltransferase family 2 protein n=1 Tax=Baaleninema simplex TaxID=2862350 RepID=UPI000349B0B8|nr:cellulose synthase catalytic subunit [Baaleninema simplex]
MISTFKNSQNTFPKISRKSWLLWLLLGLGTFGAIYAIDRCLAIQSLQDISAWFASKLAPSQAMRHPGENTFLVTGVSLTIALVTMKRSPTPQTWSKVVAIALTLSLMLRYILWRSLFTLNLETPVSTILSIALLGAEFWILASYGVQLFLMLRERDRRQDVLKLAPNVVMGKYQPSVDILIPSYDEPTEILKRTIIGCQAIDYPNKTVYLLDDTRRSQIEKLTKELGCEYLTRPDNRHAKAGNLNHALDKTDSELVLVFDADFVPTRDFLLKTVGFFQESDIGMVQTHQCFYNHDLVSRNLGLEGIFPHEVEVFSRHYQKLRDGADSSLCYGSAFVARRQALAEIGNFVTGTLGEDYFTGIRLSSHGWRTIYLDENLSAGLAAETISGHIAQRQRWVRGTLQSFFVSHNPLTVPGLTLRQRIAHLEGILQWFSSLWQVFFLLVPLAYYFLGILPVKTLPEDWLAYFLPYYIVTLATYGWLNYRSRSALISGVYGLVTCFPISLSIVQTLIGPFSQGFKVTPKGISSDRFVFNWRLALPLIVVFGLTVIGWGHNLVALVQLSQLSTTIDGNLFANDLTSSLNSAKLGLIWGLYNLFIMGLAILSFIDPPNPDSYPRFSLRRWVMLNWGDVAVAGETLELSEVGATVKVDGLGNAEIFGSAIAIDFIEDNLKLSGAIDRCVTQDDATVLEISFAPLSTPQHRQLVELLFCQPGQWERQNAPGEWRSLGYLLKAFVKPRIFQRL